MDISRTWDQPDQKRKLDSGRGAAVKGDRAIGKNFVDAAGGNQGGGNRALWRRTPQSRADRAVPKNLAGRAVGLRPFRGLRVVLGLADFGRRHFRRNVRDGMVVEHQHHQEVHLHRRQKPGGRQAPETMF